jgi:hypothetical protein
MADVLPRLVAAANADCRRRGLPPKVTLSNLITHWIAERTGSEEQRVLGTSTVQEWLRGPPPEPSKMKSVYDHINDAREEMRTEQKAKLTMRQGGGDT